MAFDLPIPSYEVYPTGPKPKVPLHCSLAVDRCGRGSSLPQRAVICAILTHKRRAADSAGWDVATSALMARIGCAEAVSDFRQVLYSQGRERGSVESYDDIVSLRIDKRYKRASHQEQIAGVSPATRAMCAVSREAGDGTTLGLGDYLDRRGCETRPQSTQGNEVEVGSATHPRKP